MRNHLRNRSLLAAIALLGLTQLGALPRPPWRGLKPGTVTTVAGGRELPQRLPGRSIAIYDPASLTADWTTGVVFVIDRARNMIFRLEPGEGEETDLSPWAGNESAGFNGDSKPALATSFDGLSALSVDPRTSELFVADTGNHRIRVVAADGSKVDTVVSSGLRFPGGVAVDGLGLLFVADTGHHQVLMVNRGASTVNVCGVEIESGETRQIAGSGSPGFGGDGGPALAGQLAYPTELDLDATGNVLVLDSGNDRIRKIDRLTGKISTIVTGRGAVAARPPSTKPFESPELVPRGSLAGMAVTSRQRVLYSDRLAGSLHAVEPGGRDRILFTSDPATSRLGSVAVGHGDAMYVADELRHLVLRVADGGAETFAGGALPPSRVSLREAQLSAFGAVAVDAFGNIFLADSGHHTVRRILMAERVVETLMGTGEAGTRGDGGPPQLAELVDPSDILLLDDWSFVITDRGAGELRKVGMANDGLQVEPLVGRRRGPHRDTPIHAARHPQTGEIYLAFEAEHRVQKLDPEGRLVPAVGSGVSGSSGDGGRATEAKLRGPGWLTFDTLGNLYVADRLDHKIRQVDNRGIIRTFVGVGAAGYSGDGGPAAEAAIAGPEGMVFDAAGNLFFADGQNHAVRRVDAAPPHLVHTVVGTGSPGFSGDGGPAREAQLSLPTGLAFSRDGFLYITDSRNRRLRAARLPL